MEAGVKVKMEALYYNVFHVCYKGQLEDTFQVMLSENQVILIPLRSCDDTQTEFTTRTTREDDFIKVFKEATEGLCSFNAQNT